MSRLSTFLRTHWRVLIVGLAIYSFWLIALQSRWWADDYCLVGEMNRYGTPLNALHGIYYRWAGLFSYFGLRYVVIAIHPLLTVFFLPVVTLLAIGVLQFLTRSWWLAVSCVLLGMVSAMSTQSLYWASANVSYTLGAVALLGVWAMAERKMNPLMIALVAFLSSGLSEAPTITALVGFTGYALLKRDRYCFAALLGVGIGLGVVLLSPGNAIRADLLQTDVSLAKLPLVTIQTALKLIEVILTPRMLLALIAIHALFASLPSPAPSIRWQWVIILFLMASSGIAASYLMKGDIAERTLFPSQVALLMLSAYLGSVTYIPSLKRYRIGTVWLMVVSLIAVVGNVLFLPDANRYAQSWDTRHALLMASVGQVTLLPLAYDWVMEGIGDIKEDWVIDCANGAYGVDIQLHK